MALIGENHPIWAIAYLGNLYRGALVTPIDPGAYGLVTSELKRRIQYMLDEGRRSRVDRGFIEGAR